MNLTSSSGGAQVFYGPNESDDDLYPISYDEMLEDFGFASPTANFAAMDFLTTATQEFSTIPLDTAILTKPESTNTPSTESQNSSEPGEAMSAVNSSENPVLETFSVPSPKREPTVNHPSSSLVIPTTKQHWDLQKDNIHRLYFGLNLPLRDLITVMEHKHQFKAT